MSVSRNLKQAKLKTVIDRYLQDQSNFLKSQTLWSHRLHLFRFNDWCTRQGVDRLAAIDLGILQGFRKFLDRHCDPIREKYLSRRTKASHLVNVRAFCRWLKSNQLIPVDPSIGLEFPEFETSLIDVLTTDEIQSLLSGPDATKHVGLRDRAILELVMSTAVRSGEFAELKTESIDRDRKLLIVTSETPNRNRSIPIGDQAFEWICRYLCQARSVLANTESDEALFLTDRGKPLRQVTIPLLVKQYFGVANVTKRSPYYVLQKTAAISMLVRGVDARTLQRYLGHKKPITTRKFVQLVQ